MGNPLMERFKPGDRVIRVSSDTSRGPKIGSMGTVLKVFESPTRAGRILASVCWDERSDYAHSCDGLCDSHHGWNVVVTDIELIEEDIDFPDDGFYEVILCSK